MTDALVTASTELAAALARALGEFNGNPEWTQQITTNTIEGPAFEAAQGRWEEHEYERRAQTEAMAWSLDQPAVHALLVPAASLADDAALVERVARYLDDECDARGPLDTYAQGILRELASALEER